ncbi:hypothetical protein I3760_10G089300 [Carya illinoinensis]|nr:hypothetical protein I3760_10G089300 [Carya illinoinensis]
MGETVKRSRSQRYHDDRGTDKLVVYRILCPDGVIGSVIGKSGKVINSTRQETQAKVKVVDPYPDAKDRVITIYSYVKEKEEVVIDDDFSDREPLCVAHDALLKVHAVIANVVATVRDSDNKRKDDEGCQILVPSSQSTNIIGKAGATIKKLKSKTRTNIKVMAKDATDPTNSCAMDFDNFVLSEAVKKALFAVSAIMYKFIPREEIPLETSVPEASPSIIIPSDVPIYPPGGLYPSATNVQDLQSYADTGNTWPLYSSSLPVVSGFTNASQSEELIIRVLCPFDKIGGVIGKGRGTIKSIRQASGARIEVNDTKYDCDECVITITATEINDEDDSTVTVRLLLPSRVIGCIIGKNGSIINEIRKRTKTDVHISKSDKPNCADVNDEPVEIVLRLRDHVLKDGDGGHNLAFGANSLFFDGSGLSISSVLPFVAPIAPFGHDWRVESGNGLGSLLVGDNGYGSMPTYSSKLYGGLPPTSTLEILVPANVVGRHIGGKKIMKGHTIKIHSNSPTTKSSKK